MSVLTEYFLAGSDVEAATVLEWPARPAGPGGAEDAAADGGDERPDGAEPPRDVPPKMSVVIDGGGIEPLLHLLVLESMLTGRDEDEIEDARSGDEMIAGNESNGPVVVKLSFELTDSLINASSTELTDAARSWADSDELAGSTDADTLEAFLVRLADLARAARDQRAHVYCWVSL